MSTALDICNGFSWSLEEEGYITLVEKDLTSFSKARSTNRVLVFPPLPSRFRFLIHKIVERWSGLKSTSIGTEPARRTVVYFEEISQNTRPFMNTSQQESRGQSPECRGRSPECRQRGRGRGRGRGLAQRHSPMNSPTASRRPAQVLYTPGAFSKKRKNTDEVAKPVQSPVKDTPSNTITETKPMCQTPIVSKSQQIETSNLDKQLDCVSKLENGEDEANCVVKDEDNLECCLNKLHVGSDTINDAENGLTNREKNFKDKNSFLTNDVCRKSDNYDACDTMVVETQPSELFSSSSYVTYNQSSNENVKQSSPLCCTSTVNSNVYCETISENLCTHEENLSLNSEGNLLHDADISDIIMDPTYMTKVTSRTFPKHKNSSEEATDERKNTIKDVKQSSQSESDSAAGIHETTGTDLAVREDFVKMVDNNSSVKTRNAAVTCKETVCSKVVSSMGENVAESDKPSRDSVNGDNNLSMGKGEKTVDKDNVGESKVIDDKLKEGSLEERDVVNESKIFGLQNENEDSNDGLGKEAAEKKTVESKSKSKRQCKKEEKAKKKEERSRKKQAKPKSKKSKDAGKTVEKEGEAIDSKKKEKSGKEVQILQEKEKPVVSDTLKVVRECEDTSLKISVAEESALKQKKGRDVDCQSRKESSDEEDDWETASLDEERLDVERLDEEGLTELNAHIDATAVEFVKPKFDYLTFQPNDITLDNGVFDHVVEIYDFSPEFKDRDLSNALSNFQKDYGIHWVDDTHALAVFSNHRIAKQAVEQYSNPMLKLRPIYEGTHKSKLKAKRNIDILQPYKERPKTTKLVANRLVTGALGMTSKMTKEEKQLERAKIKAERERKLDKEKQKKDLWESDDV